MLEQPTDVCLWGLDDKFLPSIEIVARPGGANWNFLFQLQKKKKKKKWNQKSKVVGFKPLNLPQKLAERNQRRVPESGQKCAAETEICESDCGLSFEWSLLSHS